MGSSGVSLCRGTSSHMAFTEYVPGPLGVRAVPIGCRKQGAESFASARHVANHIHVVNVGPGVLKQLLYIVDWEAMEQSRHAMSRAVKWKRWVVYKVRTKPLTSEPVGPYPRYAVIAKK